MDIEELILNTLSTLAPTYYGWYSENYEDTHIVFLEISDNEDLFGDDEAGVIEHLYQVSIFSKTNCSRLKKDIKKALKNVGFYYQDGSDQHEVETQLYHKATRWIYNEYIQTS